MKRHSANPFQERLRRCLDQGNLRIADLARWLERPNATVSTWVNKGRLPSGPAMEMAWLEARLKTLEKRIKTRDGFPVPRMSLSDRVAYIAKQR